MENLHWKASQIETNWNHHQQQQNIHDISRWTTVFNGSCLSLRAVTCPIYSQMSLCEVIWTTEKGVCMYKITTITNKYLKQSQIKFYAFSINLSIKGLGNCNVREIESDKKESKSQNDGPYFYPAQILCMSVMPWIKLFGSYLFNCTPTNSEWEQTASIYWDIDVLINKSIITRLSAQQLPKITEILPCYQMLTEDSIIPEFWNCCKLRDCIKCRSLPNP